MDHPRRSPDPSRRARRCPLKYGSSYSPRELSTRTVSAASPAILAPKDTIHSFRVNSRALPLVSFCTEDPNRSQTCEGFHNLHGSSTPTPSRSRHRQVPRVTAPLLPLSAHPRLEARWTLEHSLPIASRSQRSSLASLLLLLLALGPQESSLVIAWPKRPSLRVGGGYI